VREFALAASMAAACLLLLRGSGRLEFLRRELAEGPRRWAGAVLLFAVLMVAVFFPVATFGEAREFDPETSSFWSLFAGHALLVGFLAAWWAAAGRPPWREFLVLPRQPARGAIWIGMVAGALGWAATLVVTAAVAASAGAVSESSLGPAEVPPIMLWLAALPAWRKAVVVAVAMTVEEAFFRSFLQSRLGLGVSTLLFALAHFNYGLPLMVVAVFTISLVFGALFEVRRNLVPCMAAHGVFDAIQIFVIIPLALGQATA
jgi:membrane protease YdiL (CAAX protease family)